MLVGYEQPSPLVVVLARFAALTDRQKTSDLLNDIRTAVRASKQGPAGALHTEFH